MNLKELSAWATTSLAQTNTDFVNNGVSEKELSKVRSYLRMINDKCQKISLNTKENNSYLNDIQEYLGHLTKANFQIPQPKEKDSILPSPETKIDAPKKTEAPPKV